MQHTNQTGTLEPISDLRTREQAAYEALRSAIVAGRWAPGTPLVGSRLADELGVSRITVANALKRLSAEGFVRSTPHKGAEVAPLDPAAVREIYLMRAELEALAAREAVRHVTQRDLDELTEINEELRRLSLESADIRDLRACDWRFHDRLRGISRMPLLVTTLKNYADRCEGYRARVLDTRPLVVPGPERHLAILEALAARDAERANAAMHRHVIEGLEAILREVGHDHLLDGTSGLTDAMSGSARTS